ncbi:unnamed protein product [Closterium sp. NIES-53]
MDKASSPSQVFSGVHLLPFFSPHPPTPLPFSPHTSPHPSPPPNPLPPFPPPPLLPSTLLLQHESGFCLEEGAEAGAAKGSEISEGAEAAEGSATAAHVAKAVAEATEEEMQRVERLVTWLCGNRMSAGASDDEMQSKQESSEEELKVLKGNVSMGCIDE